MQVKKQRLELDMEQQMAVYCHPAYLTYMQSTLCKMMVWMKHNLKSIVGRSINNLRYSDDTTLITESEEKLMSLLMRVKEESE